MKQATMMVTIGLICLKAAAENYSLSEALRLKLVSVSMAGAAHDTTGNYTNGALAPCMGMLVSNNTNTEVMLSLDYGYKLEPTDSSYQTMMVSQTLIVKLPAKQKKTYRLYAMCTQASDRGPSETEHFSLGKRATGSLLGMAELVNRKRYQTDAAQNAVWCLTDNHDLQSISSSDTAMMYELRRFVAKAKGMSLSAVYAEANYVEPVRTYRMRTTYSGELRYSISRPAKVLVALFDNENHMKRVYVNNETQREGQYSYGYQITSDELEGKKYYLRMFRDGKMEEEVVINPE